MFTPVLILFAAMATLEELTRAILEATISAASAAESAQKQTAAKSGVDARLLKTPPTLHWDEKSKYSDWVDWHFGFVSWATVQDAILGQRLREVQERRNLSLDFDTMDQEEQERSNKL